MKYILEKETRDRLIGWFSKMNNEWRGMNVLERLSFLVEMTRLQESLEDLSPVSPGSDEEEEEIVVCKHCGYYAGAHDMLNFKCPSLVGTSFQRFVVHPKRGM